VRAVALPNEGPRIALVVDDEPLVRTLVYTVLSRRGWSVVEAADVTSALALAAEALDLLVTDHEMPSATGVTLAEKLRLRNGMLPAVMVSGHPEVADMPDTLHGPRTAFVGKPFPVEELISRSARSPADAAGGASRIGARRHGADRPRRTDKLDLSPAPAVFSPAAGASSCAVAPAAVVRGARLSAATTLTRYTAGR